MGKMKQLATDLEEYRDEIDDILSRMEAVHPRATALIVNDERGDLYKRLFIGNFTNDEELITLVMTKIGLDSLK